MLGKIIKELFFTLVIMSLTGSAIIGLAIIGEEWHVLKNAPDPFRFFFFHYMPYWTSALAVLVILSLVIKRFGGWRFLGFLMKQYLKYIAYGMFLVSLAGLVQSKPVVEFITLTQQLIISAVTAVVLIWFFFRYWSVMLAHTKEDKLKAMIDLYIDKKDLDPEIRRQLLHIYRRIDKKNVDMYEDEVFSIIGRL